MRYPDYLMHFGIKGMKWGVRRFQNKDGSYTPLGLKRHGNGTSGGSGKARAGSGSNAEARKARLKKAAKIAAIAGGTALAGYGAYRLAKSGKVPRIGMDKLKGIGGGKGALRIGMDGAPKASRGDRIRGAFKSARNSVAAAPSNAKNAFLNRTEGLGNKAYNKFYNSKAYDRMSGVGSKLSGLGKRTPKTTALSIPGQQRAGRGAAVRSALREARGKAGNAYRKFDDAYRTNSRVRNTANAVAGAAGAVGGWAAGRAAGKAIGRHVAKRDRATIAAGRPKSVGPNASRRERKRAAKAAYKYDMAKANQGLRDWGDAYNKRAAANKGYARSAGGKRNAEQAVSRYQKQVNSARERYNRTRKGQTKQQAYNSRRLRNATIQGGLIGRSIEKRRQRIQNETRSAMRYAR